MLVKLVSITPDPEGFIAHVARVSNPDNQSNPDYVKLIKYLIKNHHMSPFEHAYATFEIRTSRAIAAQLLRHKSFSFQEYCLSGDTKVTLKLPKGNTYKRTLTDLYKLQLHPNQHIKRNGLPLARIYDGKEFAYARILEVFKTGIKPTFKITLDNGKTITGTKEHKYLTNDGYVSLEDIIGLKLLGNTAVMTKRGIIATNGIPVYQSIDWMREQKQISIENGTGVAGIAKEAEVSYHTIRKWLKKLGLCFTKLEVAKYSKVWNKNVFGYKIKPHTLETIERMRKSAKHGKDSNLWRGGVTRSERLQIADWCSTIRAQKLIESQYGCVNCGSSIKLELDHIVPVYQNKELAYEYSNIQVLCHNCHQMKHKLAKDSKSWRVTKGHRLTIEWSEIVKVEYTGEQDTYDLHIDHETHNYVANGIVTHNSQRYSEATAVEPIELRKQAEKNRQSSLEIFDPIIENNIAASELIKAHTENSLALYKKLLLAGVAKECAREILPLATTTTLYMTGNCRSWITYLNLRLEEHTQKEHRDIAVEIAKLIAMYYPTVTEALNNFNDYKGGFFA